MFFSVSYMLIVLKPTFFDIIATPAFLGLVYLFPSLLSPCLYLYTSSICFVIIISLSLALFNNLKISDFYFKYRVCVDFIIFPFVFYWPICCWFLCFSFPIFFWVNWEFFNIPI